MRGEKRKKKGNRLTKRGDMAEAPLEVHDGGGESRMMEGELGRREI